MDDSLNFLSGLLAGNDTVSISVWRGEGMRSTEPTRLLRIVRNKLTSENNLQLIRSCLSGIAMLLGRRHGVFPVVE